MARSLREQAAHGRSINIDLQSAFSFACDIAAIFSCVTPRWCVWCGVPYCHVYCLCGQVVRLCTACCGLLCKSDVPSFVNLLLSLDLTEHPVIIQCRNVAFDERHSLHNQYQPPISCVDILTVRGQELRTSDSTI